MSLIAAAPGEWDGMIVLCASNGFDGIRMSDWYLAEQLSRLVPVLYVDPPMSPLTPARKPETAGALASPRLRLQSPRLARLTPLVQPFPSRPGAIGVTSALTRRYLRRATARLGGRVDAVIAGWAQYPVFGSCKEQVRVYWAKDDFVGGAALLGLNARMLDRHERRIAATADLLVVANPVVADTWRERGLDPILIPFGTNVDAYLEVEHAPLPCDVGLPPPVVGFIGRINDRTDLRLLEAIAGRGRSLLLVGPKDPAFEPARFEALRRQRNVRWVGLKPVESLPSYLRVVDVGIVPYQDSRFNRSCFPLKALEYLAAGRAVVSTDLPAMRSLATDLVCIAGPESFADQVDRQLAAPRTAAILERRQAFAARHSWERRAAEIREAIVVGQSRSSSGTNGRPGRRAR
jgi:glycosyltransferase involved in cell wall biosynthesis